MIDKGYSMGHHWRKPYRPEPVEKKPSALLELFELIASSFRPAVAEKNHWAMPFNVAPMAFRRRFAGRKH